MKIEIKCRFSGSVLFSHEADDNTIKLTLETAVKARAYLAGANLAGAYLAGANLARAYLAGANLAGANLAGAYLAGAYLARAYLDGANLDGANLDGAYLARAYLDGANLDGANLDGEVLKKSPISVLNLTWPVLITEKFMKIGCQRHTHEDWQKFSDTEIMNMEYRASAFWKQWGEILLSMCAEHAKDGGES